MKRITAKLNGLQFASRTLCVALPFVVSLSAFGAGVDYDAAIPGGIPSHYSDKILPVMKSWPRKEIPTDPKLLAPIWMRAVRREDQSFHIGIIKRMLINVPLKRLEEIIDNFMDYYSIFPTLKSIEILKTDGNFLLTSWEHRSPLFFLPNARYQQAYILDKREPNRKTYRYQLVKGSYIEFTDGFFAIEKVDDTTSMLTGYDFFMPDVGPLKVLGSESVWRKAFEGSFKGDMSIKLRAEHPDWKIDKIKEESERLLDAHPVFPPIDIESGPFAAVKKDAPAAAAPAPATTPEPTSSPAPEVNPSPAATAAPTAASTAATQSPPAPATPTATAPTPTGSNAPAKSAAPARAKSKQK